MTICKTPLLVSLLPKPQELPISQLAMHIDPFHLVITDKRRPAARLFSGRNTFPHSVAPPTKPLPIPAKLLHSDPEGGSPAVCAFNKSFFSTHDMVFVQQFLTKTYLK
jgi:hypothetical protein